MNDLRKELADVPIKIDSNAVHLSEQIQIVLSYVDGSNVNSKGRSVTHDEYGQVTNLLDQLEVKNSEKFCEFGGLVESLQTKVVQRLEKMEMIMQDKSDRSYIETLLEISDKLIEVVKNVEKTQKKDVLPAIIKLQSMSAVVKEKQVDAATSKEETTQPPGPVHHHEVRVDPSRGPPQELHWEDVYTKIIPSLENLTAKMNKLEDKEKIETGDGNISRILAIVQDLKDVRGGGVTSFPSDGDGSQDRQGGTNQHAFSGSESREVMHKIDVVHSIIKDMR